MKPAALPRTCRRLAIVLGLCALVPATAFAQAVPLPKAVPGPGGNRAAIPPSPSLTGPGVNTNARPHLDPGTMFCATSDDLDRYSQILAARAAEEDPPPGPAPACQRIAEATWIDILERQGPSRTKVRLAGTAGQILKTNEKPADTRTGWTDAWLPPRR